MIQVINQLLQGHLCTLLFASLDGTSINLCLIISAPLKASGKGDVVGFGFLAMRAFLLRARALIRFNPCLDVILAVKLLA